MWDVLGEEFWRILTFSVDELVSAVGLRLNRALAVSGWRESVDIDRQISAIGSFGSEFIAQFNGAYPPKLKALRDAPIGLHCAGRSFPEGKSVAIVGTRKCSFAGERTAHEFAKVLAENGMATISGLAEGIDAAAHAGTLAANGHTVAVLGCGLDVVYPPDNLALHGEIRSRGTLVSEFPFGRRADRRSNFAIRNRIITGLADAVIVVESPENGGSMISARWAINQRKPLLAVGSGDDVGGSAGCRALIRSGRAIAVRTADELLELLSDPSVLQLAANGQIDLPLAELNGAERPTLSPLEEKIWLFLEKNGSSAADDVAVAMAIGGAQCATAMQAMCLRGIVKRELSGAFSLAGR
ncbi:MAG: DNA-protecting protein DprA [Puniceicoccales bacterium]|nr:DNA-protecting protein DprA [Puniceicoccales bacterium]